ncbi:MAG: DUF2202 domain-containing protein [Brevefilum sp.]|nr:DUF2202 domain-containing protein [Brevefilum sp.]
MKNINNHKIKIIAVLLASIFLLGACTFIDERSMSEIPEAEDEAISGEEPEDLAEQEIETLKVVETNDVEEDLITENPTEIAETSGQASTESVDLASGLTDDEIAGLVYMREEEKLAKDVYLGLYDFWGLNIFQNIAGSEQTHTDAVKNLLDMFDIEDPADASPTGVFVNADLQNLYDDLMVVGAKSIGDALKVGAAIEEIDILDLQEYLESAQNEEIRRVYQNLLRGSENHLRAFTSILEQQTSEIYKPQYMSQTDYDAVVTGSSSRGGRGRGNRP